MWHVCRPWERRSLLAWPTLTGVRRCQWRPPSRLPRQAHIEWSRVPASSAGLLLFCIKSISSSPSLDDSPNRRPRRRPGRNRRGDQVASAHFQNAPAWEMGPPFLGASVESKHRIWLSGALKPTSLETSFTQKRLINTLPPS